MPDFRRVNPGDSVTLTASEWNAIVDAAVAERARRHSVTWETSPHPEDGTIVKLFNTTGQDLPRGSILGIAGPLFLPSQSHDAFLEDVRLRGVVSTSTTKHNFAILLEPIPSQGIGRATVGGIVACKVNMLDAAHVAAEAVAGDTTRLQSVAGAGKPQNILWVEAGTGIRWALVRHDVGDCGCAQEVCTVVATFHVRDCATPTVGQLGVALEVFNALDQSMGMGTTDSTGHVTVSFEGEAGATYTVRAVYALAPFAERTTWEVFTGQCGEVAVDVLLGQDDPSFGVCVFIFNNNATGFPGVAGATVSFPQFPAMGSQVTASDGTACFPNLLEATSPVNVRVLPPPGEAWIMGGFDGPSGQPITRDGCHDFEMGFQGPPG